MPKAIFYLLKGDINPTPYTLNYSASKEEMPLGAFWPFFNVVTWSRIDLPGEK